MKDNRKRSSGRARVLHLLASGAAGFTLVYAGMKISYVNWIVDLPGWLVSRFLPIDFHEGEGAAGFFAAIFLSWLLAGAAAWIAIAAVRRLVQARDDRGETPNRRF